MKKIIALCGLLVLGGVQNNKALPISSGEEEKNAERMQNALVGFVQIRDSGMNECAHIYYEFPGSSPFAVKEDYFSVVAVSESKKPLNPVIPPQK